MRMLDARSNQQTKFDNTYPVCQAPRRDGTPCSNEPDPRNPWGICYTHWRALAESYRPPEEQRRRIRCTTCGMLTAMVHQSGEIAFCVRSECASAFNAQGVPAPESQSRSAAVVVHAVYYMRFGNRIKIGTTTNLLSRSKSIPNDEVIAVEPGGYDLERRRHIQFRHALIAGQKEWFDAHSLLEQHAQTLRAEHGEPFTTFDSWYRTARTAAAA